MSVTLSLDSFSLQLQEQISLQRLWNSLRYYCTLTPQVAWQKQPYSFKLTTLKLLDDTEIYRVPSHGTPGKVMEL